MSSEYQHVPSILGYSEELCLRPANVSRLSGAKNGCALWDDRLCHRAEIVILLGGSFRAQGRQRLAEEVALEKSA